jgi:serine/threonine-protein kinase
MGEVYRAHDSRLKRDVAIKILPENFASDPERVARFQREAQALASLNHPGIGMIHDLQQSGAARFLVLELVEGETLEQRIARGPIPVDEALPIALQIAEAVEVAHERGIVHRDLKPANIKFNAEDRVKVLDFGLAKIREEEQQANLSHSPTLLSAGSQRGLVLGTASYMSPEQARGKPVDRRTDVWAFGCILYEMLTGRQTFNGDTVTDVLAKIIRDEPARDLLPVGVPPLVLSLLFRCLNKDPHQRLQHMGDARIEIAEAIAQKTHEVARSLNTRSWKAAVVWVGIGLVAGIFVAVGGLRYTQAERSGAATYSDLTFNNDEIFVQASRPSVALSPDGTHIAYAALHDKSGSLMIRDLTQSAAKPIPGTDYGGNPFFSPDGRWIGFWAADGKLRKVPVGGGAPLTICDGVPDLRGAAWGPNDVIIFAPSYDLGLWKVSAAGGKPEMLTKPDRSKGEKSHRFPNLLPDGKAVLFTIGTADIATFDDAQIAVKSLETGEQKVLINGGTAPKYLPTGHLLYARAGTLFVVRFDAKKLQVTGAPIPFVNGAVTSDLDGAGDFDVAKDAFVYLPGQHRTASRQLIWVDRRGTTQQLSDTPRPYLQVKISPDGERVAVDLDGGINTTWLYHLGRGTFSRYTFRWDEIAPIWSPDGKHIVLASDRDGEFNLYSTTVDGSGEAERLTNSPYLQYPYSWSRDGQFIAYTEFRPDTGYDVMVLPMQGDRKPRPVAQRPFNETLPAFSPDGKWLALITDESGKFEVYIQPFPGPGERVQISTAGGESPVWARGGGELFYIAGRAMMAVDIATSPALKVSKPRVLFNIPAGTGGFGLDVTPDGQKFLMIQTPPPTPAKRFQLVLNWAEDLKKQVAASGN